MPPERRAERARGAISHAPRDLRGAERATSQQFLRDSHPQGKQILHGGANGAARMTGLITEPYAPFAERVMAGLSEPKAVTTGAHVADVVWRAVHDDTGQLRFPAGPDAVALAQR